MSNENFPAQIGFSSNVVPTPKIGFNVIPEPSPSKLPPHVGFKGIANNPIESATPQIGFNVIPNPQPISNQPPQVGFNLNASQQPPPPSYERVTAKNADEFDNLCQSDTDTYAVEIPSSCTKVKNSYYPPPPRRGQPSGARGPAAEPVYCCDSLVRLHRYLIKINAGYSVASIYCGIFVMICIVLAFIGFIVHAKTA